MSSNFPSHHTPILNIFFTAGHPYLDATMPIIRHLQSAGCSMIEIGMPFSDPVADGETIQKSSTKALHNGMTLSRLFKQLEPLKKDIDIPVLLMGYLNPIMQFGLDKFVQRCHQVGIKGLIIPDLPIDIYLQEYASLFQQYGIHLVFLVTPETPLDRIRFIDQHSTYFIYVVSSSSTTGGQKKLQDQKTFFKKMKALKLKTPLMIGFGIKDKNDFDFAASYASGAIIGSAFVQAIDDASEHTLPKIIPAFIKKIKTS